MSVGERIRQARTSRRLSLHNVASRAGISVATLSRIERDKQGIGVDLLVELSRILKVPSHDLIGEISEEEDPLASRIAGMNHSERMELWHDLATQRQATRAKSRKLTDEVEELVAQLEFVRTEMESVRAGVRKR